MSEGFLSSASLFQLCSTLCARVTLLEDAKTHAPGALSADEKWQLNNLRARVKLREELAEDASDERVFIAHLRAHILELETKHRVDSTTIRQLESKCEKLDAMLKEEREREHVAVVQMAELNKIRTEDHKKIWLFSNENEKLRVENQSLKRQLEETSKLLETERAQKRQMRSPAAAIMNLLKTVTSDNPDE